MSLYKPSEKPVYAYANSHSSASKDSLLYSVSSNRVLNITDIVVANTSSANPATVSLRYATSASSASASTVTKIVVGTSSTFHVKLNKPMRVPYGSGNKVYVNANVAGAVVGVTITGYEQ